MCLKKVSKRKPKSSGFGYKVYSVEDINKKNLRLRGAYNDVFYKLGKTYTAKKLPMHLIDRMAWEDMTYKPGFHIFKFLKDATVDSGLNVVVKVKYNNAHTAGDQKPHTYFNSKPIKVIVASKITLIEVVKKHISMPVAV